MPKKFFTIGKAPGYNKVINKKFSYEDKLLPHLAFIDLIPRTLKFNKDAWSNPATFVNDVLTYANADHPMKFFNEAMKKHSKYLVSYNPGAKYDGIRLVATVDSAISNSISHNYTSNLMDEALNGTGQTVMKLAEKNKYTKIVAGAINSGAKLNEMYEMLSGNQYNGNRDTSQLSAILKSIGGHRVHMPKMWDSSNVADILQLSVKLTSPSGDPDSVKQYIIEPLIIMFIMSSPLSLTGTDVGTPFIYEVDAHGMGHYKLAGISNINFDRGGTDVDFNIYQQPLTVNVRMTLSPLASDALVNIGKSDFYKNAWFQTPDTISRSLAPKDDLAEVVEKIYS